MHFVWTDNLSCWQVRTWGSLRGQDRSTPIPQIAQCAKLAALCMGAACPPRLAALPAQTGITILPAGAAGPSRTFGKSVMAESGNAPVLEFRDRNLRAVLWLNQAA